MIKVGLVAGAGKLPLEFAFSVKSKGDRLIVFAIEGISDKGLEQFADKIYWLKLTQYRKFFFLLLSNGIKRLVLLGKFEKRMIYAEGATRQQHVKKLSKLEDGKDYSILREITRRLALIGVKVTDGLDYLEHLLILPGMFTSSPPSKSVREDMDFGFGIAKKLAGMDIGQAVAVKNKTVVAVEAMEGTDMVIERASYIAGEGCVLVKVSRPGQDMRWDVPVIGPDTVKKLTQGKFSALAVESGRMFVIDKEKVIKEAELNALAIKALV